MSSASHGHKMPTDAEDDEDDVPASQLTRPTPDAILADEADENALLGDDSDAGSSRRDSFGSAADGSESRRVSQNLAQDAIDVTATPTQAKFGSRQRNPSNRSRSGPFGYKTSPSVTDLQAQIADLTNQVSGLNTKLVSSFMRVSDLEDDLSDKHHQLSKHQEKVTSLEKEREEHLAALNTGLLVEKAHVTHEMQKMMDKIIEETAQRGKAVSDKEKIEAELDELSSSLFSEANKMVAAERLARARADEKSRNMEERLKDTEEIMEQQQKRLVEMQSSMEEIQKGQTSKPSNGSAETEDRSETVEATHAGEAAWPALGNTLVRLDVIPYVELRGFLNHLRKLRLQLAPFYNYPVNGTGPALSPSPAGSRTASPGPNGARNVPPVPLSVATLSASTALSPFTAAGVSRHKDFPNLPANVDQLITLSTQVTSIAFLKRMNEEDCEPCLRLDIAPGLNWLSRRQMHASILDGNLLIEPVFGGGIFDEAEVRHRSRGTPPAACAMCGKAVLNVPLPGGAIADTNLASSSSAPSTNHRDPSASPPSNSTTFFNSTNNSSSSPGRLTQKKSSTGLFSTLRNMGAVSPRPTISTSNSSGSINAMLNNDSLVEEDQFASRKLPIPTHIFRISESSSRYLLCPDYCLGRLRVTCNFWGYIRHLERAIVLEGKLAFDDERTAKVSKDTSSPSPARETAEQSAIAALDAAVEENDIVKDALDSESKNRIGIESVETDKVAESILEDKVEANDAIATESGTRRSSLTVSSTDGEGEDGFADAQSVHSSADQPQDEEAVKKEESSLESAHEIRPAVAGKDQEEEDLQPAPTPTQRQLPIPPLPPRSAIRRPVPKPPPPGLPPRKVSSDSHPRVDGPEPKRTISAKGETNLTWEEKLWLEMLRHKADIWSARVGMYDLRNN